MTVFINYKTGQKGSLLANFLSYGASEYEGSAGASTLMRGTGAVKLWFYYGIFTDLPRIGIPLPTSKPHSLIDWAETRDWLESDDEAADAAYYGMLDKLGKTTAPYISVQHLPMLRRHHIDDLKSRGHRVIGITCDESLIKQLEIENHFKVLNRDTVTDPHIAQLMKYATENNIEISETPVKEIDGVCFLKGLSNTDENRAEVMHRWFLDITVRKKITESNLFVWINKKYEELGFETIDYRDLYYGKCEGILRIDPRVDLDKWRSAVSKSWVPEKVNMFGREWIPSEYGYNPERQ